MDDRVRKDFLRDDSESSDQEQTAEDVLRQSMEFDESCNDLSEIRRPLYPSIERINELEQEEEARRVLGSRFSEMAIEPNSYLAVQSTPMEEKEEVSGDLVNTPMYAVASIGGSVVEPTEEASVLNIEASRSTDAAYAQALADEDLELAALKRTAAYGPNYGDVLSGPLDQEATVVSITEDFPHPSDLSRSGAVQAELIREHFTRPAEITSAFDQQSIGGTLAGTSCAAYAAAVDISAAETTEATVIDSTPMIGEGEAPSWMFTEEATVLEDDTSIPSVMDRKPAAIDHSIQQQQHSDDVAVAEQEAEVVEIQNDFHPSEFVGDDAEAELVGTDYSAELAGTDYSYSVAVAANARSEATNEMRVVAEAVCEAQAVSELPEQVHAITEPCSEAHIMIGQISESQIIAESANETNSAVGPNREESLFLTGSANGTLDLTETEANLGHATTIAETICSSSFTELPLQRTEVVIVEEDYSVSSAVTKPSPPSNSSHSVAADDQEDAPALPCDSIGKLDTQTNTDTDCINRSDKEASRSAHCSLECTPPRRPFGVNANESWSSASRSGIKALSQNISRGTNVMIETLFGDPNPLSRRSRATSNDVYTSVRARSKLPWAVIYSEHSGKWVVTLQTNQKALDDNNVSEASKSLRAFSLPTEKQAVGLARAWAPPMMMDFTDCPSCHICKRKFAVLCRACHCRNCGVCVCNDCAIQWPAKMIPDTYNVKKNYSVNVCKSCDWLCNAFRRALLEGKRDEAVALHSTGNINLRSSFANVKGELFFPVHCAVLGGNLQVLKWLVDEHCCPIKSVQICGISKDSGIKCTPIVTSKGRSLLGIAMETQNVAIVRYLVVDKDVRLAGEKDITAEMLLLNLDAVLRLLPYGGKETRSSEGDGSQEPYKIAVAAQQNSNTSSRDMIEESSDSGAIRGHHRNNSDSVDPTRFDECIICFDNKIDCVATPCGHQMCCLQCSKNIERCPVCARDCDFLRVFKP